MSVFMYLIVEVVNGDTYVQTETSWSLYYKLRIDDDLYSRV